MRRRHNAAKKVNRTRGSLVAASIALSALPLAFGCGSQAPPLNDPQTAPRSVAQKAVTQPIATPIAAKVVAKKEEKAKRPVISMRANARHDTKPYPAPSPDDPKTKLERYLIIHADDVGLCDAVNQATIDGLEQGIISSASIMVPCPKFEEFAKYASEHPQYDYGIHLTLNAEFQSTYRWEPVLGARAVPSLVNADGDFWQESYETAAHAKADEVERELSAQIERALERKIPLSHLDSHMGTLFSRVDLTEVYVNLGIKYNLPVLFTRSVRDMNLFGAARELREQFGDITATLDKHGLPLLDHLVMDYSLDPVSVKRNFYSNQLRMLPAGVSEVVVHVAYDGSDLRKVTTSPSIRDGDRQVLMNPALADLISKLGIKLIGWKEFRKLRDENKLPTSQTSKQKDLEQESTERTEEETEGKR